MKVKFLGLVQGVSSQSGNDWFRCDLLVPREDGNGYLQAQIFTSDSIAKKLAGIAPLSDVNVEFSVNSKGFATIHQIN